MAKPEFAQLDAATASVAVRSPDLPERLGLLPLPAHEPSTAYEETVVDAVYPLARSLDVAGTTPTFLPDLLRRVSREAGRMARDPFNALDNNPFITREWLIVQQVLHTAAASMEKRFEALFLGL